MAIQSGYGSIEIRRRQAPEWFRVFEKPVYRTANLDFDLVTDDAALKMIVEGFNETGREMVIDYHHQSIYAARAPAAGWIDKLEIRDDGLWVRVREWTPDAQKHIILGEYRYFSPYYKYDDKTHRITNLINVTLTNEPAKIGIKPLADAKKHGMEEGMELFKKLWAKYGPKLNLTGEPDEAKFEVALDELVTRAEGADEVKAKAEADVKTATDELTKAKAEHIPKDLADELELKDGDTVMSAVAKVKSLKTSAEGADSSAKQVADLQVKVTSLEDANATRDAAVKVADAMKAGKITPADKGFYLKFAKEDPGRFDEMVAKMGPVVPTKPLPKGGAPAGAEGLTDEMIEVAKQSGVKPEDLAKTVAADAVE